MCVHVRECARIHRMCVSHVGVSVAGHSADLPCCPACSAWRGVTLQKRAALGKVLDRRQRRFKVTTLAPPLRSHLHEARPLHKLCEAESHTRLRTSNALTTVAYARARACLTLVHSRVSLMTTRVLHSHSSTCLSLAHSFADACRPALARGSRANGRSAAQRAYRPAADSSRGRASPPVAAGLRSAAVAVALRRRCHSRAGAHARTGPHSPGGAGAVAARVRCAVGGAAVAAGARPRAAGAVQRGSAAHRARGHVRGCVLVPGVAGCGEGGPGAARAVRGFSGGIAAAEGPPYGHGALGCAVPATPIPAGMVSRFGLWAPLTHLPCSAPVASSCAAARLWPCRSGGGARRRCVSCRSSGAGCRCSSGASWSR